MNLSVFFFEGFGVHRDLLSFPTRRSSDLDQSFRWGPEEDNGTLRLLEWMFEDGLGDRLMLGMDAEAVLEHPLEQDRKSTRLNSSHPSISYAVFCLKKKIEDAMKHAVLILL